MAISRDSTNRIEWPTVFVGVCVVSGWLMVTTLHRNLHPVVVVVLLGTLLAWSSSFQHELLHGHPTPWRAVNDAIGRVTFELWLPYDQYKRSHLRHHRDEFLTDPVDDPESYYVTAEQWDATSPVMKRVLWANRTLLGRLVIGPVLTIPGYLWNQAREVISGNGASGEGDPRKRWAIHAVYASATISWLVHVGFSWWQYGLAIWISQSYIKMRSFAEHRWMPNGELRTATVSNRGPLALVFLNNNLHTAHHADMRLAWYKLPSYSRETDAVQRSASGPGWYRSYVALAVRYLVRPFDQPVYENNRFPAREQLEEKIAVTTA